MKNQDKIDSFIGKEAELEGKFSYKGGVRIDGRINGEINVIGELIVGDSAIIKSEIHVSQIKITGEVRGNIIADKKIEIYPSGRVFGNIQAPAIVVHEGAVFQGNCSKKEIANENEKNSYLENAKKLSAISK